MPTEPFLRIHNGPPGLDRVSPYYDDPAVPGQKVQQCECGRIFRPSLQITHRYPFVTTQSKDPERCDACQPRAGAS